MMFNGRVVKVGDLLTFAYCKGIGDYPRERSCLVERIGLDYVQGWDDTVRGYRTFSLAKITELVMA